MSDETMTGNEGDVAMNEIVKAPPATIVAGNRPTPIVPRSLDEVWRIAKAVCSAGMAPRGLETPEKVTIAIMHGLEVGFAPLTALQRIAVVNGRPTIWGDGAIGLVRSSGLLASIKESVSGDGDARKAVCIVHRKGDPEATTRTFSVADAKVAGLWNKAGPWREYPDRMLQMRARAFCLRDVFADVLGGLYLREEIEEGAKAIAEAATDVTPRKAPPPPPPVEPTEVTPPPRPAERIMEGLQQAKDFVEGKPTQARVHRRPPPPPPLHPEVEKAVGREGRAYLEEDRADAQQADDLFGGDAPRDDLDAFTEDLIHARTPGDLQDVMAKWEDTIGQWGRDRRNLAERAYETAVARINKGA